MQKVKKNVIMNNRLGTLWRQRESRGEFHHKLHLTLRAWNEHPEREIPEEGVKEDNEIYPINIYIRLTKWTTLLMPMQGVMT